MKTHALNSLNQPIDGGKTRTREQWQRYGEKRLTEQERRAGWVAVVGLFGDYFRINYAAQPVNPRFTLRGNAVR